MKTLAIILIIALSATNVSIAQNTVAKGAWSTEIQFNPFDQDGETFKLDGLKLRYFMTDKDVLRFKVNFNTTHSDFTDEKSNEISTSTGIYNAYDNKKYKYQTGDFNIDLGYERHFNLAKRLSIYVGGSIGFGRHFASTDIESSLATYSDGYNSIMKIYETFEGELKNGAITSSPNTSDSNIFEYVNDRANYNISAAAFAGLDFYIYKGLFIGTEFGIRYRSSKDSKMTFKGNMQREVLETGYQPQIIEKEYDEETTDRTRITNVKIYIEPVLRLGVTF